MPHLRCWRWAILAVLLAGCGTAGMKPDALDKALVSVSCEAGPDCQQKWQLAHAWVEDNSHFPILHQSDLEITTNSSSQTLYPIVSVRKVPQEDGSATIEFRAECENLIGCVPSESAYASSFSDYLDSVDPPEDSGNDVDIGLTFSPDGGLLVQSVTPGSPAAVSGLRAGDRLMKFNGANVSTAAKLNDAVRVTPEGAMVSVQYLRQGKIIVVYMRL